MDEIDIVGRFHVPNQENFEVVCAYQGKEWRVKVESHVKIRLLIFFEIAHNHSRKKFIDNSTMEDWIAKEFIRFRSSEGTLQEFMNLATADHTFDRFVYFIQKNLGLGIRNDPLTSLEGEE